MPQNGSLSHGKSLYFVLWWPEIVILDRWMLCTSEPHSHSRPRLLPLFLSWSFCSQPQCVILLPLSLLYTPLISYRLNWRHRHDIVPYNTGTYSTYHRYISCVHISIYNVSYFIPYIDLIHTYFTRMTLILQFMKNRWGVAQECHAEIEAAMWHTVTEHLNLGLSEAELLRWFSSSPVSEKKIEIQVYWVSGYLHSKFQGKRVPIYGRTHEMILFLNILDFDSGYTETKFHICQALYWFSSKKN